MLYIQWTSVRRPHHKFAGPGQGIYIGDTLVPVLMIDPVEPSEGYQRAIERTGTTLIA